jgi:hypothetical protein
MTVIERQSEFKKIIFDGSATSMKVNFAEGYPVAIYSPVGGPTSITITAESPAAEDTYVVVNDASDAALVITLQANEWTNVSDEEMKAMMGKVNLKFTNGGGSTTATLYAKWCT